MKKDAEIHAEEDKKKKDKIDVRNQADGLIFNLEKQMREYDAKIPDDVKKNVNAKMNELRDLLRKEDASIDDLKKSTEALAKEAQEIGKVVYEEAQKKGQEGKEGEGGKEGKKGKVVDAEVVDENDKKNDS